ncbi:hypothetical protein [Cohnella rhizosphaerae]|uniref:Uncharacterized protein n=1 Tax=Cohnella rhizosphaerae TaxID=1457232 RepID=A0A9X4KWN1_9BACL|nr:hypothetical protein [Cohnella rhizosphaerae]MDG0811883.1 hypothetical protein [Cohnella rhizosphaerae]
MAAGGLFLEADAEELKNIIDRLQTQDQTMTYYGFSRDQLEQFVSLLPGRQVDRIVPVGAALDFAPHWDGFDLFAQFTRNVHLLIR